MKLLGAQQQHQHHLNGGGGGRNKSSGKFIGDFLGFLEGLCSATGDRGRLDGPADVPAEFIVDVPAESIVECMTR